MTELESYKATRRKLRCGGESLARNRNKWGFTATTMLRNFAVVQLKSVKLWKRKTVQLLIMPMMFVLAIIMAIDSVKLCKEK